MLDDDDGIKESNSRHPFLSYYKFFIEKLKIGFFQKHMKQLSNENDDDETGWDRIVQCWYSFNRGEDNVEFRIITNSFFMGGLCGFVLGAFIQNREVFQAFVQKHNANVFHGQYRANRQLVDTMYLELFKRSTKHAIRYSLFSGSFVTMLTLFTTYRNDVYYGDCALAGALTGSIWKSHLGMRAFMVNAIVGSFFGLTFASLINLSMKITGTSIKQLREDYASESIGDNIGGSFKS